MVPSVHFFYFTPMDATLCVHFGLDISTFGLAPQPGKTANYWVLKLTTKSAVYFAKRFTIVESRGWFWIYKIGSSVWTKETTQFFKLIGCTVAPILLNFIWTWQRKILSNFQLLLFKNHAQAASWHSLEKWLQRLTGPSCRKQVQISEFGNFCNSASLVTPSAEHCASIPSPGRGVTAKNR